MKKTTDLTQGDLSAQLVRLAAPLILGNILQQLYNAMDAWVVGRYAGELEFAAIGAAGSVMDLFLFAIVGACTGISVIFAQFYGGGDLDRFRREHFLALTAGILCSLAIGVAGIACAPMLLRIIQMPAELMDYARSYLSIVLLGLPMAYLYNLYSAILRAVGRTSAVLTMLAAAVAGNLGLDLWFVAGLGWGIRGAAWATVLAQVFSAVLCILYLRRAEPRLLFRRSDCVWDRLLLRQTGRISFVTAMHQSGLYIGKLLVQGAVNTAGTSVISAYTATTRIEGFANSFGSSGASATSVVAAQNLGAGRENRVQECFSRSFRLLLILGIVSSLVLYAAAGPAAGFMLGTGEGLAYESACTYMRTIAVFYVFCFTGNAFAGYFNGCGQVTVPLIGSVGHITIRVILSWVLIPQMGLKAVAAASGIGWILVNLFWALVKRHGAAYWKETDSRDMTGQH